MFSRILDLWFLFLDFLFFWIRSFPLIPKNCKIVKTCDVSICYNLIGESIRCLVWIRWPDCPNCDWQEIVWCRRMVKSWTICIYWSYFNSKRLTYSLALPWFSVCTQAIFSYCLNFQKTNPSFFPFLKLLKIWVLFL